MSCLLPFWKYGSEIEIQELLQKVRLVNNKYILVCFTQVLNYSCIIDYFYYAYFFGVWQPLYLFFIVGKRALWTFFKTSSAFHQGKQVILVWNDIRVSKRWPISHLMWIIPSSTSICVDLHAWATVGSILSRSGLSVVWMIA